MNLFLNYKDPVILINTTQDGYGDNTVSHVEHLYGLFVQKTGQSQINYTEIISSDAHVYLDIQNEYVLENAFRLEGMYIIANVEDFSQDESWYRISRAVVGQRKLLDNEINNVECFLTKCEPLEYGES